MSHTVTAKLKYLHLSPRKVRFVADTIRGLSVNDAEGRLRVSPRRPAGALLKLLRSAVANATNNAKLDAQKLFIQKIFVDQGPKTKRWMPRARGSASLIERKTCHVSIVLGVATGAKQDRYTFLPKPKKEKADAASKKKQKGKKPEPAEEDRRTREERQLAKEKPASKGGFMKRMFRRKSI